MKKLIKRVLMAAALAPMSVAATMKLYNVAIYGGTFFEGWQRTDYALLALLVGTTMLAVGLIAGLLDDG